MNKTLKQGILSVLFGLTLMSPVLAEKFNEKHECRILVRVERHYDMTEGVCTWKGVINGDHMNVTIIDPKAGKYTLSGPTLAVAIARNRTGRVDGYRLQNQEAELVLPHSPPVNEDDYYYCYSVRGADLEVCMGRDPDIRDE